jgi:16S rRNA (adenine1518-N6/adenine1519-N6)-dimethyltransferase
MRLTPYETPPVQVEDEKWFFKVVKAGFNQRRKTLTNALQAGLGTDKEQVARVLEEIGLPSTARIEQLNLQQLADLANRLLG